MSSMDKPDLPPYVIPGNDTKLENVSEIFQYHTKVYKIIDLGVNGFKILNLTLNIKKK